MQRGNEIVEAHRVAGEDGRLRAVLGLHTCLVSVCKEGPDSGEAYLGLLGHKLFELLNGPLLPLALRLHCRRRHLLALRGVM